MCFYTKQTKQATELENRFRAKVDDMAVFRTTDYYNGFTYPKTPVITNSKPEIIQHLNWGLIPSWAKDESFRQNTLNARIETLTEKPSFRDVVHNRCLVIADGFYEWQWLTASGSRKQKYLITLPDNGLIAFAGLYSNWTNKQTGEILQTYTIITTEANPFMSEIHNHGKRMPFILKPEQEPAWLRGVNVEAEQDIELVAIPETPQPLLFF
ncbi:MAG: SOS response-associated peptidase [Sphingobacteriales bacterium]|nr:SOS response-associated peptidase [Sphingobacteriales bacterium]